MMDNHVHVVARVTRPECSIAAMGSVPGAGEATDFTDYTNWERCLPAKC